MFRTATPADAPAIATLHTLNWQAVYRGTMTDQYLDLEAPSERLRVWTDRFALPKTNMQTAVAEKDDGALVAFVCVFPNHSDKDGHLLDNLHVHSDFRGKGLGKKMMHYAARWLLNTGHHGQLFLWVLTPNSAAIGFYKKLGGRLGRTENHTFHGDQTIEAIMMSWELTKLAVGPEPD